MKKEREIVRMRRGIAGVYLVPGHTKNHPLLTELFGGDDLEMRKPLNMSLEDALKEVKEVAKSNGITLSVCGNRKLRPVLQLWRAPKAARHDVPDIFAPLGRTAAHGVLSELYDRHELALKEALSSEKPFTTGWYSSKKELESACITRLTPRGPIRIEVGTEIDEPQALADTAVWTAAGGAKFSDCGAQALSKFGLDTDQVQDVLEELARNMGPTRTQTCSTLHWRCGFARVSAEVEKSVAFCDEENDRTFRDAIADSKRKLRQLSRSAGNRR